MLSRRSAMISAFVAGLAFTIPAWAAETPFTQLAFDAAQQAGKPILIEVHAAWCPTCRAQAPILDKLSADPKFSEMTVLRVDFDTQKDVCKAFGARQQSTLIVFKAGKEAARSVGETDPEALAQLLDKAL